VRTLWRWIGRAGAAVAALAAVPLPAAAPCQLVKIAELSVTMADNRPFAAVSINGHAARMLVGTGAVKSALWRPSLEPLGLHAVNSGAKFYGINGPDEAGVVTVRDFGLGGSVVHDIRLFVVGRGAETAFAGVLGDDFLARFDVEFDLASQVIRLFDPKNCTGDQVVYWASSYSMAPLVHRSDDWPTVKVLLNGHEAQALLDSGSTVSGVSSDLMRRPGVAPGSAATAAQPISGLAVGPLDSSLAVFPTLAIGQEQIQNVRLRVADLFSRDRKRVTGSYIPVDPINAPDMIIGADFFHAHRIYIARSQDRVYFTYRGGPRFQTEAPAAPATGATAADPDGRGERGTAGQ
jgi:predicted aspartyl protease